MGNKPFKSSNFHRRKRQQGIRRAFQPQSGGTYGPGAENADVNDVILALWTDTYRGQNFAGKIIAETFTRLPDLSEKQRRQVVSTLYGMLGHARRLDHALSGQIEQLSSAKPRALAQLLAYRLLKGLISPEQARKTMSRICWAEVRAADAAVAGESDPVKKLGLTASLPDFLAQSLWEQYGAESELLAQALHRRPPLTVRANLLKTTREELLNDLSSPHGEAFPTPFSTTGITLSAYLNIFELDLFKAGKIELQDEASQFIAELTAPPPDGLVVDFCAGSGGKTLALGALMKNRGRLIAADVNERKLDEFRKRARRAGLSNARAVLLDEQGPFPETLQAFVGKADRVLVDVPCSGAGAIRRKPEIRLRLTPEDPIRLSQEQEMIARRAMPLCAPGGRLIYATCSLLAEENERVVERLLRDDNFYLVPLKEILGKTRAAQVADASGMYLRMLPHIHNTDGFFAAVLRRRK